MTWPLVKPASGYSTLSRFDNVSWRSSTLTVTFRGAPAESRSDFGGWGSGLTDDLVGRLVRAQPPPGRMPQPAVARPLAEAHLADQPRLDPARPARVLPRDGAGERRVRTPQRPHVG